MRRIAALAVAAGILVSVAACSSTPTTASCGPSLTSGESSNAITASGDFGSASVTAKFPTPLVPKNAEVSVLTQGTGPLIEKGHYVQFEVTQYDATTGAASGAASASYVASDESDLSKVFECMNVGSRIAAVVPTSSGTYAFVFDLVHEFIGKADGAEQPPVAGLPQVVTAPDGTPGITVANLPIPTSVTSAVLKAGNGTAIAKGDTVYMKYTVFDWSETKEADGSTSHTATVGKTVWGTAASGAAPITATAGPYDATAQTGFFPGTDAALMGQKVGSQVIVVVPPADSYPSTATPGDNVATGSTRVYVIDILDVVAPAK